MLNENEETVLDLLARTRFATRVQIGVLSGFSTKQVRLIIEKLQAIRLISEYREYKPFCFTLSNRGLQHFNLSKPKHFYSGSAIHQYLMRNAVEIELKKKNPTVRQITRKHCFKIGAYPAIGEHFFSYRNNKTKSSESALIIIDDYLMPANRITHIFNRVHDPKKSVVNPEITDVITWERLINNWIIYATSSQSVQRHEKYIKANRSSFSVIPSVRNIEPVWKMF